MIRTPGSTVLLTCVALLAACGGKPQTVTNFPDTALLTTTSVDGAYTIALRTAPAQPPARGLCTGEYTITDASGAPATGLAVAITPWMAQMGHGATLPTITELGGGKYLLEDVNLFMPGLWELRTTLRGVTAATTTDPQLQIP